MIWFAFIGLLMFVVAGDVTDMCTPTGLGCMGSDMTGDTPSGYEYDCANGDYRVRAYANAECSGDPAQTMTRPSANESVACGSCTSYIKFAGSVYGTDDCSGTAAGTATQAVGRGDSGLFDVCLDGTIVQCNDDGNSVVLKNYAKDDCTGAVKDSFTWKKNACAQFFSNSTFMKFTEVECKGHQLGLNWWIMAAIVLLLFK
eukprot:584054_1